MFQFVSPPLPHYISCGEDTYPPGGTHPDRSSIGVFDLLVVTRGCLYLEEAGKPLTIAAGHYGILRPDVSHRTARPCVDETHFYWLHFQTIGSWNAAAEQAADFLPQEGYPYTQIGTFSIYIPRQGWLESLERIESLLRSLMQLDAEPAAQARWKQQIYVQDLLSGLQNEEANRLKSPYLQVAEQAAEFLRRHYKEQISYKRLSDSLHFHPNYISICMKKAFGCTPLEYVTKYRVEQAKLMLIHTDHPVGLVAEQTGFGSFPYFVRCFTRHAGKTPKSFRMLYRNK